MGLNVTPEEQEKFRELNKLRMKTYRDKTRQRKYTPRTKKNLDLSVQEVAKEEKK